MAHGVACCCLALAIFSFTAASALCASPSDSRQLPGWSGARDGLHYKAAAGAGLREQAPNRLELSSGTVLVEAGGSGAVTNTIADVYLKRGATVLLIAQKNSVRCMVLWDSGSGSVHLVCNKRRARLGAGDEALATDHDPDYKEIMLQDEIGRRRIKIHNVGTGKSITTSEFSLLQALERQPLLYEVFRAPEDHERALKEKIVKTAAVLNLITARRGQYSTGSRF